VRRRLRLENLRLPCQVRVWLMNVHCAEIEHQQRLLILHSRCCLCRCMVLQLAQQGACVEALPHALPPLLLRQCLNLLTHGTKRSSQQRRRRRNAPIFSCQRVRQQVTARLCLQANSNKNEVGSCHMPGCQ
jgi:hypothetical protein